MFSKDLFRRVVKSRDYVLKNLEMTTVVLLIRCPVLMVTGDKASFNHTVHNLWTCMSRVLHKNKIDLLELEGVANVLEEKVRRLVIFLHVGMFSNLWDFIGNLPIQDKVQNNLTDNYCPLLHTHFNASTTDSFRKHCGKRRNCS